MDHNYASFVNSVNNVIYNLQSSISTVVEIEIRPFLILFTGACTSLYIIFLYLLH